MGVHVKYSSTCAHTIHMIITRVDAQIHDIHTHAHMDSQTHNSHIGYAQYSHVHMCVCMHTLISHT